MGRAERVYYVVFKYNIKLGAVGLCDLCVFV